MRFHADNILSIIVLAALIASCRDNSTINAHNRDSADAAVRQPSDLTSGKGHYAYNPDSASANKGPGTDVRDSLKNADANKR